MFVLIYDIIMFVTCVKFKVSHSFMCTISNSMRLARQKCRQLDLRMQKHPSRTKSFLEGAQSCESWDSSAYIHMLPFLLYISTHNCFLQSLSLYLVLPQ